MADQGRVAVTENVDAGASLLELSPGSAAS